MHDPPWWTERDGTAWDRVKGAFRRGRKPKGLARRIFFAFGLAIVTTFLVAGAVFAIFGPDRHDRDRLTGMVRLVGDRFAYDFDDARAVRPCAPLGSLARCCARRATRPDVTSEIRQRFPEFQVH